MKASFCDVQRQDVEFWQARDVLMLGVEKHCFVEIKQLGCKDDFFQIEVEVKKQCLVLSNPIALWVFGCEDVRNISF